MQPQVRNKTHCISVRNRPQLHNKSTANLQQIVEPYSKSTTNLRLIAQMEFELYAPVAALKYALSDGNITVIMYRPRPLYTAQPNTWHKYNRLRVYDSVRSTALKFLNDDVHPTTNDLTHI